MISFGEAVSTSPDHALDMLAFVVSTDGPVTVFCDGQRIADLKRAAFKKTGETIDGLAAQRRAERIRN